MRKAPGHRHTAGAHECGEDESQKPDAGRMAASRSSRPAGGIRCPGDLPEGDELGGLGAQLALECGEIRSRWISLRAFHSEEPITKPVSLRLVENSAQCSRCSMVQLLYRPDRTPRDLGHLGRCPPAQGAEDYHFGLVVGELIEMNDQVIED